MISRRFQKCPSNQRICAVCLEPRAKEHKILGQQFATLLDVTRCVRLHTLLHVVACCWELLRKVRKRSNFSAGNSHLFFFCSVIAEA